MSKTVLVTGGATREFIDPVKFISTPSSGLTGIYFAREASAQGAKTVLVLGYCSRQYEKLLDNVDNIEIIRVKTTREMYDSVKQVLETRKVDIAVFTAAPLDYMLSGQGHTTKINSEKVDKLTIELVRAPKIIELVRDLDCVKVGFKAEWDVPESELIRRARSRLIQYMLDMVIVHDVSRGLGFETTHDSVLVVDKFGLVTRLERVHKRELARTILHRAYTLSTSRCS
jgi:phosphopantothenoylcysteine decarboxylase/phosphopantothenate--cysteine ligase